MTVGNSGVRTVGIDLAAQPANTGVCVIDWDQGAVVRAGVNSSSDGDSELVELMTAQGVGRVGIDTPLGWPDAFVEAIAAHHAERIWPGVGLNPDEHRRTLRLRRTDIEVASQTGRHPMSVSADRIAVAAMRGARLQALLIEATGDPDAVDRSGTTGLVAETYPAAALGAWGLPSNGYKGSGGRLVRDEILDGLVRRAGLVVADDAATAMVASDHVLDAFVCALVARAVLDGATTPPSSDDWAVARREGWIHVPDPQWCGPGGRSA